MTTYIPKESLFDKFLMAIFRQKRLVIFDPKSYEEYGAYVVQQAKKESIKSYFLRIINRRSP